MRVEDKEYLKRYEEVNGLGKLNPTNPKLFGQETISFQKEFWDACQFVVEGETTGYMGGDAGHGGFLKISFYPGTSFAGHLEVFDKHKPDKVAVFDDYERYRFSFMAQGDAEISQLHEALRFLVNKLDKVLKN